MEFWQILRFYRRYGLVLIVSSLLTALLFGILSSKLAASFGVSQSIFVRRETQPGSGNYYSYDGYYSQQAAERFTDTVVAFLKNKDIINQAATESGLARSPEEVGWVMGSFRVKRAAPQLITVSIEGSQRETVVRFVEMMTKKVTLLSVSLNAQGDKSIVLNNLESSPFVEEKRLVPWVVPLTVFGLMFLTFSLGTATFNAFRGVSGKR